jgi:hypothetical protein
MLRVMQNTMQYGVERDVEYNAHSIHIQYTLLHSTNGQDSIQNTYNPLCNAVIH